MKAYNLGVWGEGVVTGRPAEPKFSFFWGGEDRWPRRICGVINFILRLKGDQTRRRPVRENLLQKPHRPTVWELARPTA